MSEKLAIEARPAYALELAGTALSASKLPPAAAQAAAHQNDRIHMSALARAIASPDLATRLDELAAAFETGRYRVAGLALSRRLLAEHTIPSR